MFYLESKVSCYGGTRLSGHEGPQKPHKIASLACRSAVTLAGQNAERAVSQSARTSAEYGAALTRCPYLM